jgi:hypothetical protein
MGVLDDEENEDDDDEDSKRDEWLPQELGSQLDN